MALKKSQRSLKAWGKQKWRTKSGKKSSETGERYLPEKAIKALSAKEYAATTKAKRKAKENKTAHDEKKRAHGASPTNPLPPSSELLTAFATAPARCLPTRGPTRATAPRAAPKPEGRGPRCSR